MKLEEKEDFEYQSGQSIKKEEFKYKFAYPAIKGKHEIIIVNNVYLTDEQMSKSGIKEYQRLDFTKIPNNDSQIGYRNGTSKSTYVTLNKRA